MKIMIIENDNNDNDSDNDDKDNNNDSNDDNKIPVDSPHKGPIMLSFDDTFVEAKNNSRVSGDLRRYVRDMASQITGNSTVVFITVVWYIYATPSYLYCCKQL